LEQPPRAPHRATSLRIIATLCSLIGIAAGQLRIKSV
jgi:hypothetical protein